MRGLHQNTNKALNYFFLGYIAYLLSHFIAPKAIYSSLVFYLAVIAPLACHLYYSKDDFVDIASNNKTLIGLLLYILVHSIIMIPEMQLDLALKGIRNILATFLFLLASLIFFQKSDDRLKKSLLIALSITCGVLALASVLLHLYANHSGRMRLMPLGFAHHEILGASLYAIGGIISLYMLFTASRPTLKLLYLAIYSVILVMILMTVSRGPILAYIACTGLSFLFFTPHLWRIIILSALGLISVIVFLLIMPEYLEIVISYISPFTERGTSYRLELWQLTINKIIEQPILGYGIRNVFVSDIPGGYSPHNLYLSTAYYFGIPALFILLAVIAQAFLRIIKELQPANYNSLMLVLLAHAIFSVITDHGQLARGNTPIWIIFWLPICMCLAYSNKSSSASSSSSLSE